tara:strand:+ start:1664 stop:1831 length:168 start_codon:yes stop_codon:yes gene_type:complete
MKKHVENMKRLNNLLPSAKEATDRLVKVFGFEKNKSKSIKVYSELWPTGKVIFKK